MLCDLVKITSCETSPIAHLLRGRLEAEGIVTFVADEAIADWYWPYSRAAGGVSVLVPTDAEARAQEILDSPLEVIPTEDPALPGCPACGSLELEREFPLRRPILIVFSVGFVLTHIPWLPAALLRPAPLLFVLTHILMIPAALLCVWRWWHCRTCDEWSRELTTDESAERECDR